MNRKDHLDLNLVFERLSDNRIPNFLELMSAIEDIGSIVLDSDSGPCADDVAEKPASAPYMYPPDQQRCPECSV